MSISTDGAVAPQWDQADRLRKSLRVAGMSAQQMADYLEVHRNTVSTWINGTGQPTRPMLIAWALRTGVLFDWLNEGTDTPPDGGGPGTDKPVGYLHPLRPPAPVVELRPTG